MEWLSLVLILVVAGVSFALSRRVSVSWRLAIGIPLMLWVLYYLVEGGAYGYAVAMLLIFSYGIARQLQSLRLGHGDA
jgi:hypothetical protein